MKTNFNLDLALFFTSLSIILYSCGYFYIQAYVKYFDYSHEALGFDFQNYLVYGGLQGFQVIILGILVPITLSLINKFIGENITKSITKSFNYLLIFVLTSIFKITLKFLNFIYTPVRALSNFIYKFPRLSNILDFYIFIFLLIVSSPLVILIFFLKFIIRRIKPSIYRTHRFAKREVNWDNTIDTPNIDKGFKELLAHYLTSILIYAIFILSIYYLMDVEKDGYDDAKKMINNGPIIMAQIKDDKITEWYKVNKINEPKIKNIKILKCGKSKCLIAVKIPSQYYFTEQNLLASKLYLITTINNDSYSVTY